MRRILFFVLLVAVSTASGCATGPVRKDRRCGVDPFGPWSVADTRLAAEDMVSACTSAAWVGKFDKTMRRDPVIIVGPISGQVHGHPDARVFVENLQMALINSGTVKLVSPVAGQLPVNDRRADFVLQGNVHSVVNEASGQRVFVFQAALELVDRATRQKVWAGQKKLKKIVKGPRYSL